MAIVMPSSLVSDIRGAVGDVVFARSPGGLIVRARTMPDETVTDARQECRDAMSALGPAWSSTLTEQQRTDWHRYSHTWPRPNRLGGSTHAGGYQCFTRHNMYVYREDQSIDYPDPPVGGPIYPPICTMTFPGPANQVTFPMNPANYDPPAFRLALYLFMGKPVNIGRNFYMSPWRYVGVNFYVPPWNVSPWTVTAPWGIPAGKRIFAYIVAQAGDTGELSTPYYFHGDNV